MWEKLKESDVLLWVAAYSSILLVGAIVGFVVGYIM